MAEIKITHTIVIPWPVSSGIHTWCGHRSDDEKVCNDYFASSPEAVTCPHCAKAMRAAKKNLDEWIPGLTL